MLHRNLDLTPLSMLGGHYMYSEIPQMSSVLPCGASTHLHDHSLPGSWDTYSLGKP